MTRSDGIFTRTAWSGSAPATFSFRTRNERKKTLIVQRLRRRGFRDVVLFEDESDLRLFPPLRAAWAPRGQTASVALTGINAKRVIFGSINVWSGKRLLLVTMRQTADDFAMYLNYVRRHYRGWHVIMLVDGDSCHTAATIGPEADRLGIELLPLPKRSPELNAMEALWGDAKNAVCANRQYESIDEQVRLFVTYIESMSNDEALRKAGLLSSNFWLFQ